MKKTFLAALCLGLLAVVMIAGSAMAKDRADLVADALKLMPANQVPTIPTTFIKIPEGVKVDPEKWSGMWVGDGNVFIIKVVVKDEVKMLLIVSGWYDVYTKGIREIPGNMSEDGDKIYWTSLKGRNNFVTIKPDSNEIWYTGFKRYFLTKVSDPFEVYPNFFGSADNATAPAATSK
ncbi:MAG: hypothetical protein PHO48_04445 [Candidatus Gracilibacteria bacterium]|nr:hypothetical protein [Candidatus Gracilibacteria bacterium]MDD5179518.1 hypothetical protein [Candidatus Gracilibacteria bacterium]